MTSNRLATSKKYKRPASFLASRSYFKRVLSLSRLHLFQSVGASWRNKKLLDRSLELEALERFHQRQEQQLEQLRPSNRTCFRNLDLRSKDLRSKLFLASEDTIEQALAASWLAANWGAFAPQAGSAAALQPQLGSALLQPQDGSTASQQAGLQQPRFNRGRIFGNLIEIVIFRQHDAFAPQGALQPQDGSTTAPLHPHEGSTAPLHPQDGSTTPLHPHDGSAAVSQHFTSQPQPEPPSILSSRSKTIALRTHGNARN